jgi:radical SAM superfamily enzyme YgiQ (UPF0313 family)
MQTEHCSTTRPASEAGIGIVARLLLDDGIEVRILNLNNEVLKACRRSLSAEEFNFDQAWKEPLVEELIEFVPDFVGVTSMFSQSHQATVHVCTTIKEINPLVPLALGGVHVTNCFAGNTLCSDILKDLAAVDLFFLYEAEAAFRYFVRAVNGAEAVEGLYQVYFRASSVHCNAKRVPNGGALNVIPAHDLMNTGELSQVGVIGSFFCLKDANIRFASIISNRGCRGRCTYCSVRNFNGPGVRMRSVQSVIDELFMLRDRFGIGHVMWLDDDLFFDSKRAMVLFNEMVRQKLGMTWDCSNGVIATSCREDVIAAAEESGCIGLNVGVESGNSKMLKEICKPARIEDFLHAASVLKKHERINSRVFLMIGFPNETYRMILDTFTLALQMDLDWYNITILQPLPNTPIMESMMEQGLAEKQTADQIRYNCGAYGKKREKMARRSFGNPCGTVFTPATLDHVPTKAQLEDVWLYMNVHLNLRRLCTIQSPVKLEQQYRYVNNVTTLVAPDDPFPMYFFGYLQKQANGFIDPELIARLENCLKGSEYWRQQFNAFELSPEHLKTGVFLEDLKKQSKVA